MPLDLDAADQRAVREVVELASRAVATVQPAVGDERAMNGAFVSKVMEASNERGLDVTVRGFPDAEETWLWHVAGLAHSASRVLDEAHPRLRFRSISWQQLVRLLPLDEATRDWAGAQYQLSSS